MPQAIPERVPDGRHDITLHEPPYPERKATAVGHRKDHRRNRMPRGHQAHERTQNTMLLRLQFQGVEKQCKRNMRGHHHLLHSAEKVRVRSVNTKLFSRSTRLFFILPMEINHANNRNRRYQTKHN